MVLGAVAFQMNPKGVSWPHGGEEDALWLFTERACQQLSASFVHLPPGSVPAPGGCRASQEGWREGNCGLIPTMDTGTFSLTLDGRLLSAAPLGFISAGS